MKKGISIFLVVIVVIGIMSIGVASLAVVAMIPKGINADVGINTDVSQNTEASEPSQEEAFSRVTFAAVGDNLIHDTVYEQAAARSSSGYDFSDAYDRIAEKIAAPDVAILNQETIIST